MVRGSNSVGGQIFRTCPDRPWGPPSLCKVGNKPFPGVKSGRGVTLTPHSLLVRWSWKSRSIPLLSLWAVRPVQSLSACTRVHFTFYLTYIEGKIFVSLLGVFAKLRKAIITFVVSICPSFRQYDSPHRNFCSQVQSNIVCLICKRQSAFANSTVLKVNTIHTKQRKKVELINCANWNHFQ